MELACKSYVGGKSYYCNYDYYLLYIMWASNNVSFTLCELATMSPLGWHPPHLVDNTDTLYLGDQHWQSTVLVFFRFLFFCIHLFAYVSVTLCVTGSVWSPSQVFKKSLLQSSQLPLSQKMIKMQRLTWVRLTSW